MNDLDNILEAAIAILLAIAGGMARLLNLKDKQMLKFSRVLSELFVSGFTGLMILLLARSYNIYGDLVGVICGMSGWVGPKILDTVLKFIQKQGG